MAELSVQPPLSNVQVELLKLFSTEIPEDQLAELKLVIAKFLLEKSRGIADDIWDKKEYSDEKLFDILTKER